MRLFADRGFDETSVEDIATAAGIGRRTFFRYYSSKLDLVWGDFETELEHMRAALGATGPEVPMMQAVRAGVVGFNRIPPEIATQHRQRLALILGVPTLIANSTLRFAQWRGVVAEFVAARTGCGAEDLLPRVVAHCALGAAVAAYEEWLQDPDADLTAILDDALGRLAAGFATTAPPARATPPPPPPPPPFTGSPSSAGR